MALVLKKLKNISKRGQKIIPGQPILQLHVERNSPSGDQPSSSKKIKKENLHPKKSNKKRKPPQKIITDDDWICADCGEVWDEDGDCCWIICDICVSNYHLECSGIQYPTEHYWDMISIGGNLNALTVLFIFSWISCWNSVTVKLVFFQYYICLHHLFVMFFPDWAFLYQCFACSNFVSSSYLKG